MNFLYADFAHVADFLTVYIQEAHAQDEWPVGEQVDVNQPKTIQERSRIAKEFIQVSRYILPMVLDTMDNQFEMSFNPWPVRFYIVLDGTMIYKAQPNEENTYDLGEIRAWLQAWENRS